MRGALEHIESEREREGIRCILYEGPFVRERERDSCFNTCRQP